MYHFRVRGENEYGVGAPADIGPVKVCMAPGPVNKFEVADFSKTHANLVWAKPLVDGGSRITNYVVDWCLKEDFDAKKERWIELSTQKNCTYKVMGMDEGVEYIVRVTAMNDSGLGEPREKVIAGRDPTEIPSLNTSDYPDLNVYLREGTSKKIIFHSKVNQNHQSDGRSVKTKLMLLSRKTLELKLITQLTLQCTSIRMFKKKMLVSTPLWPQMLLVRNQSNLMLSSWADLVQLKNSNYARSQLTMPHFTGSHQRTLVAPIFLATLSKREKMILATGLWFQTPSPEQIAVFHLSSLVWNILSELWLRTELVFHHQSLLNQLWLSIHTTAHHHQKTSRSLKFIRNQ